MDSSKERSWRTTGVYKALGIGNLLGNGVQGKVGVYRSRSLTVLAHTSRGFHSIRRVPGSWIIGDPSMDMEDEDKPLRLMWEGQVAESGGEVWTKRETTNVYRGELMENRV